MLDVLEYGLDRVTDPNENKVNQVRQAVFCFVFPTPTGFVQKDPDNVPGVAQLWQPNRPEVEAVSLSRGWGSQNRLWQHLLA